MALEPSIHIVAQNLFYSKPRWEIQSVPCCSQLDHQADEYPWVTQARVLSAHVHSTVAFN